MDSYSWLKVPFLYLVIDMASCGEKDLFFVLEKAILGGVDIVQLREKNLSGREYVKLGKMVKKFLDEFNIPLIINDRVDVALAVGAHGVHVGQEDIHPLDIRKFAGRDLIVGLSVNTMEHAKEANKLDVDYVGIGPVFPTITKKDAKPFLDLHGLKKILRFINKPCVAIGGITISNCREVMNTGVQGIAVVSAICGAEDPYDATKKLKESITQK